MFKIGDNIQIIPKEREFYGNMYDLTTFTGIISTVGRKITYVKFNNALGIRESYKIVRDALRSPMSLERYFIDEESQKTAKFFTNYIRDIDESKKHF